MFGDRVTKITFLISLSGHLLLLSMPEFKLDAPLVQKPENISIVLRTEIPPLLPKIKVMGEEKKLKTEDRRQKTEDRIEPQPKPEPGEIVMDSPPKELMRENIEVIDPQKEAMLRYQDMVKQRIEEARRYPHWAKRQGIEGISYISFTVLSNGLSQDIKIVRSSGSKILDEEAVATIKRASPFPAIPGEIGTPSIQMEVSIVFRLQ